jgi:hypothetical protein
VDSAEPSPLAGVAYERGLSLLHFREVGTDAVIDEFASRFAAGGADDRARLRSAMTEADCDLVLTYAWRASARSLRHGDGTAAARAAAALGAVDATRIDARDLIWQAALLSYAIVRTSGDAAATFRAAAALADGQTAELLGYRADKPVTSLREWGYREILTPEGSGLISCDYEPYAPRTDLVALAQAVAVLLADGTWRLGDPTTGARLQAVWLRAGDADQVRDVLRSITGCVNLDGILADLTAPGARAQRMLVFLAETEDQAAAGVIAAAAGGGDSVAIVGVASGLLCAVLIARSVVEDVPSAETQASLERFRTALTGALAAAGTATG